MRGSKSFGNVILQSIGVMSSCIAASLLLSTTSAKTPGPNYGLLRVYFKTTPSKVSTVLIGESTRFLLFKSHKDLSTPQLPRISLLQVEGGLFVHLTTSETCVLACWVCWPEGLGNS